MKTKQTLKKIIILNFILFVALGVYTNVFQPKEEVKIEQIFYPELVQLAEENKDKEMTLFEYQDGTVEFAVKGTDTQYTLKLPEQNNLNELITQYKIKYDNQPESKGFGGYISTGLTLLLPIILIIFILSMLSGQKKALGKGDSLAKANSKKTPLPDTTIDDVGGITDEIKKEIYSFIDVYKNADKAKKFDIRPAKGVIFHGPPGTGKTLLAKAIVNEIGASLYSMSGSSFVEMYVGVGAARVRKMFEEARKNAPSVIFIDEIDALGGKRGGNKGNEEREATLNEFLAQIDGMEGNDKILVIGATNRLDMMDEAFLRPGRFDMKIMIDKPDLKGRKEIIDIHTKKKPLAKDVVKNLEEIAKNTYGYSGADIEGLFLTAANHAFASKKEEIDMEDIDYAIDRSLLGSAGRQIPDQKTKERVAYHEAGHALIGALVDPGSVRKATIVPRGGALGFVASLPKEMNLQTRSDLINHVKMILAGGVAERKMFKEHSVGVGGDVQQALRLIDNMVDLGMTNDDFVLIFNEKDKEKEKQKIFNEALEGCKEIIEKYNKEFEKLAQALLEKETIDGIEVDAIVFNKPLPVQEVLEEEVKEAKEEELENIADIDIELSKGNA